MSRRTLLVTPVLFLALTASAYAEPLFRAPSLIFEVGPAPSSVAIGDLNRDGWPDLVVTNSGVLSTGPVRAVSVLLGNGDGTFAAPTYFETGIGPQSVAIADLNEDGRLDLVTANYGDYPDYVGSVSMLLGNGDGTFGARTDFEAGRALRSVAIADMNQDGHPDLVTERSVLLGNGDGTFGARIDFAAGTCTAIEDFNGDGRLDLVTNGGIDPDTDDYIGVGSVLLGNGDGTFGAAIGFETGLNPFSMAIADFDGDGRRDLAVANYGHTPDYYGTVSVLLGNGDGTFRTQRLYNTGANPNSVATADLNRDGRPDLVTSNVGDDPDFDSNTLSVFLGNGDGTFRATPELSVGENPVSVAVADLDGDGVPDLVTPSRYSSTLTVLLGNGDGTFGTVDTGTGTWADRLAIADLNGDGRPDVVTGSAGSYPTFVGSISVHLGNGDGTLGGRRNFVAGSTPYSLAIADLNGDGRPDLVVAKPVISTISVHLGSGDGTFGVPSDLVTGGHPYSVAIADLNGDVHPDLVVAKTSANTVLVLLGNGDGTFGGEREFVTGLAPTSVAISDLNGDGLLDLVTANEASRSVSVLLGNGDGSFASRTDFLSRGAPTSMAIADLNTDGRPDLAVTRYNSDSVLVLLGKGDGTFGAASFFFVGVIPSVVIADFDVDGRPDLATAGGELEGIVSVLLGNGDATFRPRMLFGTGRQPTALASADLNGDGRPDLVTANARSSSISVLLATGDRATPVQMSLVSADASRNRVVLRWWGEGAAGLGASVYRHGEGSEWERLGDAIAEGADLVRYEDRAVTAGARYAYRLGYLEGATESFTDEVWVDVPAALRLALEGFRPNPAFGAAEMAFTLADGSPATIEVLDLAGRRVLRRDVGGLGAGRHAIPLDANARLAPGAYLMRLRQAGRTFSARGVVVR